jgi:hypothetical protein
LEAPAYEPGTESRHDQVGGHSHHERLEQQHLSECHYGHNEDRHGPIDDLGKGQADDDESRDAPDDRHAVLGVAVSSFAHGPSIVLPSSRD